MRIENAVFLLVLLLAVGFFSYNVQRLLSYLWIARPDDRGGDPLVRLKNVITVAILQKKILRDPVAGPMHALIFWGFCVLTVGTIELLLHGSFPSFSYAISSHLALPVLLGIAGSVRAPRARRNRLCVLPATRVAPRASRGRQARAQRCIPHPRRHRGADGHDVRGECARARPRSGVDHARQAALARALDAAAIAARRGCSPARTRCSGGRTRCSCSPF